METGTTKKYDFSTISEFLAFLDRPVNSVFKYSSKGSNAEPSSFRLTPSYRAAMELLKNGWDAGAEKITKLLLKSKLTDKTTARPTFSTVGYQASVPRYLQGIPTNMVFSKREPKKVPILVINHSICYSNIYSPEEIMKEGMKVLSIVNSLESQGTRVKLNVMFCAEEASEMLAIRVCIKTPGERLNISKVAFPLAHPDFLRRIIFKFIEVEPTIRDTDWSHGYGRPIVDVKIIHELYPGEYFIPERVQIKKVLEELLKGGK